MLFDELLGSHFGKSSTEEVEHNHDDSFGYNMENFSELRSEAVSMSLRFSEVDGLSVLFRGAGLVWKSQNKASNDFWCLEAFDFQARNLVRGGCGNSDGGSISDGSVIWMCLWMIAGVIAGATGIDERGSLWTATVGSSRGGINFSRFAQSLYKRSSIYKLWV